MSNFFWPTSSGASQAQIEAAIDAALASFFSTAILAQDIHNAASTNINANGGAFVAFGSALTIPAGTKEVQISSNLGEPVQVSFAANLGAAAASASQVYLVQGGAPGRVPFIPGANNLVFIRSLSATAITDGYIAINFYG